MGRTEGYIRPFVEEAAQVLPLLRRAAATRPDPYLTELMEHAERAVPATAEDQPGSMLEPLTTREREVLGYLPSHLSVPDIAAKIYVSPNTVKSHLKSIYRKMGAASRGDAVTIAVSRGPHPSPGIAQARPGPVIVIRTGFVVPGRASSNSQYVYANTFIDGSSLSLASRPARDISTSGWQRSKESA